jgi:hypothetical protein
VMSFYTLALMGVAPLGSLLAGFLANQFGAPHTILVGAPFCLLGALMFARTLPYLRQQARKVIETREQQQLEPPIAPPISRQNALN